MSRKRIMLLCHEGVGLGHLRRISRIAEVLQQRHSCLIVTGIREAFWLVPQKCELLKLPSWEGIDQIRAARRGREPTIDMSRQDALAFRSGLMLAAAQFFNPHAILVDYLPFGHHGELRQLLAATPAKKYLIHRGITDSSDESILRGPATEEIADIYDRIMVMADVRVSDLAVKDRYCPRAAKKIEYCGYIVPEIERRMGDTTFDVVSTGGGGNGAEELLTACLRAAERNSHVSFCVVLGPRSRLSAKTIGKIPINATVIESTERLPELLASASVVVSTGGYNSILETVSGGGRIIVHPNQQGDDDEQLEFVNGLSSYYPIRLARDLGAISEMIAEQLKLFAKSGRAPFPLAAEGLTHISRTITLDLDKSEVHA
jgi:predicted glycosyltransferase